MTMHFTGPYRLVLFLSVVLSIGALVLFIGRQDRPENDIPIPFMEEQGSGDLRGQLTTIGRRQTTDVVRVTFPQGTDSETLQQGKIYSVSVPDDPAIASVPLDQLFTATGSGSHSVSYFGYKYITADAATEKQNRNDPGFRVRFPGRFFASQKARDEDSAHGNGVALFEARRGITMEATSSASGVLLERNSLYLVILNDPQPVTITIRQSSVCGNGAIETGETCDDSNTTPEDGCSLSCETESGWTCTGTSPGTCTTTCGDGIRAGTEECDDGKQCSDGTACNAVDSCVGRIPFGKENLCLTRDGDGCAASCQSEVSTTFRWTQDTRINPPRSCTDLCAMQAGASQRGACVESGCPAGLVPAGGGAYYRNGDTWGSATCSFAVGVSEKYCCCRATTLNSCGDGFLAGNEQCDDGNLTAGDGCSVFCAVETGWTCTGEPSVCTQNAP